MYADSPRARNIDRSLRDQRRSRFGSFRVSVVVARPPSAERVVLISRANRVELFRLAKEPTASMQASTALQLGDLIGWTQVCSIREAGRGKEVSLHWSL